MQRNAMRVAEYMLMNMYVLKGYWGAIGMRGRLLPAAQRCVLVISSEPERSLHRVKTLLCIEFPLRWALSCGLMQVKRASSDLCAMGLGDPDESFAAYTQERC